MIVTIDGPAGTGKSTVARRLANVLGFDYLDTGAMYRMVALKTVLANADPGDSPAVSELVASVCLDVMGDRFALDGEEVGSRLRTPEVTRAASLVAQIPAVRERLVERQRELARGRNIVCEGRDQGTVVFPKADCKFYLTARPEERARRRQLEIADQGVTVEFDELLREQAERDQRDAERSLAPLRPAADAVVVDTTNLDLEAVVGRLQRIIQQRQAEQC